MAGCISLLKFCFGVEYVCRSLVSRENLKKKAVSVALNRNVDWVL